MQLSKSFKALTIFISLIAGSSVTQVKATVAEREEVKQTTGVFSHEFTLKNEEITSGSQKNKQAKQTKQIIDGGIIIDRDMSSGLNGSYYIAFNTRTLIPIIITAQKDFNFVNKTVKAGNKLTIAYHFLNSISLEKVAKSPAQAILLPDAFQPMTEWQAVIQFATQVSGGKDFSAANTINDVLAGLKGITLSPTWINDLYLK